MTDLTGHLPINGNEQDVVSTVLKRIDRNAEANLDQLISFTGQVNVLYRSGFTFAQAINIMQRTIVDKNMLAIADDLRCRISNGMPLAKTLYNYPQFFPSYYIKAIETGEQSGTLEDTFNRLLEQLKGKRVLQRQLKKQLLYPKLAGSVILAGSLLILYMQGLFELSFRTLAVFMMITAMILLAKGQITNLLRNERWKRLRGELCLNMPILDKIYLPLLNKQFAELFQSLYKSGLSIIQVFQLIGDTIGNSTYGYEIRVIGDKISSGSRLADAIRQCKYFPDDLIMQFDMAAHTGEYDKNLDDFIQRQDHRIESVLFRLFQSMTILTMGMMVTGIIWMVIMFKIA